MGREVGDSESLMPLSLIYLLDQICASQALSSCHFAMTTGGVLMSLIMLEGFNNKAIVEDTSTPE